MKKWKKENIGVKKQIIGKRCIMCRCAERVYIRAFLVVICLFADMRSEGEDFYVQYYAFKHFKYQTS